MREIVFAVHTLIPESTKFVQTNKIGMFPCPLSLSLGHCVSLSLWFSFYANLWFYYTDK